MRAMKNAVTAVLALGIIGGSVWFVTQKQGGGSAPGLAQVASAQHTAAFFAVEDLAGLLRDAEGLAKALPKEALGPAAMALDPAKRNEMLGFDPLTDEGWASVGIDAKAGFGVVLDDRAKAGKKPLPLLLLKFSDRAKLIAAVEKKSGKKVSVSKEGELEKLSPEGDKAAWVATKAGFTAIALGEGKTGLADFAKDAEPLTKTEAFTKAFASAKGAQVSFFLSAQGMATLLGEELPKEAKPIVDFYKALFPAAAGYYGKGSAGMRLAATEKGVVVLRKLLRPKRAAPAMARYFPARGWQLARATVNVKDWWEGLAALIPPGVPPQVKAQLGAAKEAMPAIVGFSWAETAAAFSGHLALGMNMASLGPNMSPDKIDGLVVIGLADGAKAKTLVQNVVKGPLAAQLPIKEAKIGDHDGYLVNMGPVEIAAAFTKDVLVIGPGKAKVEAALARKDGLSGKAAEAIDGEVAYGFTFDMAAALKLAGDNPVAKQVVGALPTLAKLEMVSATVVLDKNGLAFEGGETGLLMLAGLGAAVAIPAFVKYQQRAVQAGQRMELEQKRREAIMKAAQSGEAPGEGKAMPEPVAPVEPVPDENK